MKEYQSLKLPNTTSMHYVDSPNELISKGMARCDEIAWMENMY
jgi:hypothetical protein